MTEHWNLGRGPRESVAALIITVLAVVSGGPLMADEATVRGTAAYRERIALPPGAILEVTLEDVSLADAPAKELGSVSIEDPGNPPFEFEIAYDPAQIDDRHTYAVRATIRLAEKLIFTTDTTYPVLTRGAGKEVELMLRRVARSAQTPTALEGTYWKLIQLGSRPAPELEGRREPHLTLDADEGRAEGTGGCNRFSGSYEVEDASISFGTMALSSMACVDDADVDRELVAALEKAATYRILLQHLELLDGEGAILARFEAKQVE